ncbi:hypothetical protein QJS10_CPB18g00782 [Acorus calamus]|uniref:Uncharacterized protein n=1 Tax=Acorus calamus TaxID=4465 RepID=A0AAV9CLN5_ACOCL|nr:hypothetical protein QJS10_CPB18g00782 [Acorus calamus]
MTVLKPEAYAKNIQQWDRAIVGYVIMQASTPLPDSVLVEIAPGARESFKVDYDWKPTTCKYCQTFGHDEASCVMKPHVEPQNIDKVGKVRATTTKNKGKEKSSQSSSRWQALNFMTTGAGSCSTSSILLTIPALNTNGYMQYLPAGLSDNTPLHVVANPPAPLGPRPFKYFSAWELHTDFAELCRQQLESAQNSTLVDPANQSLLTLERDAKKIKKALFSMKPHGSPGPDGFTAHFFQTFWPTVKKNFLLAVSSFFQTRHLLKQWNHTFISLIPTVKLADSFENCRPMSLSNVAYKTKIMAERLQQALSAQIEYAITMGSLNGWQFVFPNPREDLVSAVCKNGTRLLWEFDDSGN